jgi:trans-aconitate 2-methyltransferase
LIHFYSIRNAKMAEWNADAYAAHSSLQAEMARRVLESLDLDGAPRVLDVGCGDGRVTAAIAARIPGGSVVGVDPSRSMIEHASRQFGPSMHPKLRFEVADAASLPYRGEFDRVVSFNALHWVPDQDAALRSIRAALRPGGRARLRFVPEGGRRSLEDVLEDVRESHVWSAHFDGFRRPFTHPTPDEYRARAERAGFVVDEIGVSDESWDFRDREGFAAFARATFVGWTGRLPEAGRDRFIGDVLDRYRSIVADGAEDANTFKFYQMDIALTATG